MIKNLVEHVVLILVKVIHGWPMSVGIKRLVFFILMLINMYHDIATVLKVVKLKNRSMHIHQYVYY